MIFSAKESVPHVVAEEKDTKNVTSQEILDEIIQKLHLLDSEKRGMILSILKKQHIPANKTADGRVVEDMKADSAVDDEVEILEMEEPKLGKYKRKRSKC